MLRFHNLHDFSETGRTNLNAAVFAALKPGGHYGVVDHTRRHTAADTEESWQRMDPVQMIQEVEAAGFELRYEVGMACSPRPGPPRRRAPRAPASRAGPEAPGR